MELIPLSSLLQLKSLHAQGNVIPFLGKQQIPEPVSL